ncbi:ankyrin repeat domain-containing protein [Spirillospora sp. CA-255316]
MAQGPTLRRSPGLVSMEQLDWKDFQGEWPPGSLHAAVAARDHGQLRDLLRSEVDIDRPERLMTPLHVACERWNVEAVRLLISCGASLDTPGPGGWTPLALAVARAVQKGTEILDILIRAGADPDKSSDSGDTPRSIARTLDTQLQTNILDALQG